MAQRLRYLVFSDPVEGREDEFNKWYDEVHVPEIVAMPGLISAQRYTINDTEFGASMRGKHRYMVMYEMEGDPAEVMGRISEAVQAGEIHMHDALDLSTVEMSFWDPHGPLVEHT